MRHILKLVILAAAPLLMAALWMDRQPSYKPYQEPVMLPSAGSVPVTGREVVSQDTEPRNPVAPTRESLSQGKILFAINCAMCHGISSAESGPVGKKLTPQPPGLDRNLVRDRSDAHIYRAISLGFGRMPPFKNKLTQQERWEVINFLRTRK